MIRKILSAVCGGMLLGLPSYAQNASASLNSTPLKVYGDSVKFEATITVPKHKVFKKKGTYVIMPELGETKFDPIKISSEDLGNISEEGIKVTINSSAYFDEDMIGNDLEIEHEYEYKNGAKNVEFNDMDDLAECCINTGTLFSLNGQYELMNYEYTAPSSAPLKIVAQVNFPLDISKFSTPESKEVVDEIGNFLYQYPNSTINIKGFASPEGTVERNRELADNRANEVKDWLMSSLKRRGYGRYVKSSNVTVSSETEDWTGFEYVIEQSDLSSDKQTAVMTILNSDRNAAEKEDGVLKELNGYDNAEKFLMPLRRTTIVVSNPKATRMGYTKNQIDSINSSFDNGNLTLSAMKDVFTQEELLQASQRSGANAGKLTLLTSYYKTYPGDVRAYSNLGALSAVDLHKLDVVGGDDALVGVGFSRDLVDLDEEVDLDEGKLKFKYKYKEEEIDGADVKMKMKQDLADAEVYLMKAYHADRKNFVTLNNLGAHYLTVGEYAKAKEYLDKSAQYQDSEGVNYNLGVYHARMGDYNKAADHFSKVENVDNIEYNRGLAHLMTGNNRAALEDFQTFARNNAEYALGHYLTAVAAARVGNMEIMTRELEHAMNRNPNLSDIAEEDLEFEKYWDHKEFKEASDDDFTQTSDLNSEEK